jgi:4-hydroxybenzoate polyprenyltransferase
MAFRGSDIVYLIRIARPLNLFIAGVSFALGAFLSSGGKRIPFTQPDFYLELVFLLLIMAGGYWINDVVDYKIDLINKPHRALVNRAISTKKVFTVYLVSTFLILLGSALILPVRFFALNFLAVILLYLYSQWFKPYSVVGNLIISLLTSLVILGGAMVFQHIKLAVLWAMLFAFLITFLREVTKDIEDIRGDLQFRLITLPIQIGIRASKWVLMTGIIILIVACNLPVLVHFVLWHDVLVHYWYVSLIGVQVPLLLSLYYLGQSVRPADFERLSKLFKLIMMTGMASLILLVV